MSHSSNCNAGDFRSSSRFSTNSIFSKYRFVCQTPRPKVAAHSEVKKIAPSDTPLLEPSVVGGGEALDVVDSNLWMCRGERAEVANSEFGGR